jgi:hypothetical protein
VGGLRSNLFYLVEVKLYIFPSDRQELFACYMILYVVNHFKVHSSVTSSHSVRIPSSIASIVQTRLVSDAERS